MEVRYKIRANGQKKRLSNLSRSPVAVLGETFPSVEHCYQYLKAMTFNHTEAAVNILAQEDPFKSTSYIQSVQHADAPTLLSGLRVMVHTENRNNPGSLDFVRIWAPLVRCMGAEVLETLPKDKNLDILLTDASCPYSLLNAAEEQGADTISSEWLIQAIITGERPAADAHEKFRYNYGEQVGGAES